MQEKRYNSELLKLGKRLKYYRNESGLTQLDLELRTGITRSDISKIENGLKNIEFYTLIKLVVALEVEIHDLFSSEIKNISKKNSNR
jgi:transcriptional regulator with XRE-family HTH domain